MNIAGYPENRYFCSKNQLGYMTTKNRRMHLVEIPSLKRCSTLPKPCKTEFFLPDAGWAVQLTIHTLASLRQRLSASKKLMQINFLISKKLILINCILPGVY